MTSRLEPDVKKKLDDCTSKVDIFFDTLAENSPWHSKNNLAKIEELLSQYPQSSFLKSWKGIILSRQYYYNENLTFDIINYYLSILEKDPFSVNAYEELAVYFYINNNYEMAEQLYRVALSLEPTSDSLRVGLCEVLLEQNLNDEFMKVQLDGINMYSKFINRLRNIKNER